MKIIDAHTHVFDAANTGHVLLETADAFGFDAINVLSIPAHNITQNIQCAYMKHQSPTRIFAFGGLDYESGRDYVTQAQAIVDMGFDGFKMLEGKPTVRKELQKPLNAPEYDAFYEFVAASGLPLLIHVADPSEFWDIDRIPKWALKRGYFCDETFVPFETLITEAEDVAKKHPNLKLIFAHFFFMSDNIKRAEYFFETYPNVHFDITSGTEMYFNFSKDADAWRAFFTRYADRIVFGTDSFDSQKPTDIDERDGILRMEKRFLTTADSFTEFHNDVKGINLDNAALEQIFYKNFERLAGTGTKPLLPRPLNTARVHKEIETLMAIASEEDKAELKVLAEGM